IAEHLERAVLPLRDALDQLRRRVHRVRLRIFQVGAGRERATALVAGEDGAPDVVVLLHGVEVTLDPLVEVGAPGVTRRRAAERDDPDVIALLVLDRHAHSPPTNLPGARGFQDRAGHPEAGHLPVVGELRALVGARALGVRQPEVAQAEEPLDLRPDIDVGEQVARVRILAERDAVALGLLTVAQQPIPHAVAADAAAGAVLQLEMRAGRLPALVLAADQTEPGPAHLVDEPRVLLHGIGAALAARAHQLHGLHGDARKIGVDHEPRQVLVARAARVRARDHPDAFGAVVAADEDLLAVDDVLVAVANGRGGDAGQVRAGAGL